MRHDVYLHREGRGTKERGDKTQTKEGGRAGARDIHPCWSFVAANVIAWNGAKTLGLGSLDQFSSKIGQ